MLGVLFPVNDVIKYDNDVRETFTSFPRGAFKGAPEASLFLNGNNFF